MLLLFLYQLNTIQLKYTADVSKLAHQSNKFVWLSRHYTYKHNKCLCSDNKMRLTSFHFIYWRYGAVSSSARHTFATRANYLHDSGPMCTFVLYKDPFYHLDWCLIDDHDTEGITFLYQIKYIQTSIFHRETWQRASIRGRDTLCQGSRR